MSATKNLFYVMPAAKKLFYVIYKKAPAGEDIKYLTDSDQLSTDMVAAKKFTSLPVASALMEQLNLETSGAPFDIQCYETVPLAVRVW